MSKILYSLILSLLFITSALAQLPGKKQPGKFVKPQGSIKLSNSLTFPPEQSRFDDFTDQLRTLPPLVGGMNIYTKALNDYDQPTWIEGDLIKINTELREKPKEIATAFFAKYRKALKVHDPSAEFILKSTLKDEEGFLHQKFTQIYDGLEIWNGEILIHSDQDRIYLFNGNYYPTPSNIDMNATLSASDAENYAKKKYNLQIFTHDQKVFMPEDLLKVSKVIYYTSQKLPRLAYSVTIQTDILTRYELILDAITGQELNEIKSSCSLHYHRDGLTCSTQHEDLFSSPPNEGPATANAVDLNGVTRTIHTYQSGSNYYLIDASRPMFNSSSSSFPENPVGVVWTVDANNKYPSNSNFTVSHVTSANNVWNNPKAVSAHYNGGVAYEYFKNTYNRNSINGLGGNIISIINVSDEDGTGLDNAFWNGQAMFYGNGKQSFKALAGGLDVAGHEMSHGVIQATANLTYQGESGALNESFADIFGVLIDRDDWQLGEDIVRPGVFPTNAMRDVSNPHNGGSSLSDQGWQPNHMNEKYNGSQDNGGVHINSGIVNFAFYKVASQFGKNDAEKIYYNALTKYLTKSSQFIDCRNAVIQATKDFYNNDASKIQIVENAYTSVGIGSGSGTSTGGDYQVNSGTQAIVFASADQSKLQLILENDNQVYTLENTVGVYSKPSISDDGALIVWVGLNKNMYYIQFNWGTGNYNVGLLDDNNDWRNVVVSKNKNLIAGLLDNETPYVYIFDLTNNTSKEFLLYNPTTASDINTGDVDFADAMEFNHIGNKLMYDSQNSIKGKGIEYWDISFIEVYNNASNTFASGRVEKLFSTIPDNTSIGNPTFSKNSRNIIAFDYIESTVISDSYAILGCDIEHNDTKLIFENSILGYPSYAPDDKSIIFNAQDNSNNDVIGIIDLNSDKISGTGQASLLQSNATWGNWFANGVRVISSVKPKSELNEKLIVYPNPTSSSFVLNWESENYTEAIVKILDANGVLKTYKKIDLNQGINEINFDVSQFASGIYFIEVNKGDQFQSLKIIKH